MTQGFDTRGCIFPVLLLTFEAPDSVGSGFLRDASYLGTGFFLRLPTCVAFITAGHVVSVTLNPNQRIGFGNVNEAGKQWWWDQGPELHPTVDLAFARCAPEAVPPFVRPLELHAPSLVLNPGTAVSSFGFPFTSATREFDGTIQLEVDEIYFKGYIAAQYSAASLVDVVARPFSPSYALSFESPRGLSGAPLLVHSAGEAPTVAGIVYANRKTHFLIDEYDEMDSPAGPVVHHRVVQVHHFGLASTGRELAAIAAG